jgi:hypothetical protein
LRAELVLAMPVLVVRALTRPRGLSSGSMS